MRIAQLRIHNQKPRPPHQLLQPIRQHCIVPHAEMQPLQLKREHAGKGKIGAAEYHLCFHISHPCVHSSLHRIPGGFP